MRNGPPLRCSSVMRQSAAPKTLKVVHGTPSCTSHDAAV